MMHFTSRNPAVSAVIATNGKRPELLLSLIHISEPTRLRRL